jgi:thymidylate kinase
MLIMLDGIDGSGKSTIIQAWKQCLADEGNAIFDLKAYWQANGSYPPFEELKSYDFVFSCEPTYAPAGKVIREELIKSGTAYPAQAIAEAYSLDRLILYTKIIVPLLNDGKCVIEDRGISSTLCYQTTQHETLTFSNLSALPGNALALEYRPDHLVLLQLSAETATSRLEKRYEKKDDSIFEKIEFQKKLQEKFFSGEYQKLFTDRGTVIHALNADAEVDIMKAEANKLFKEIINPTI